MILEQSCGHCGKSFEQIKVRNIGRDQAYCSSACRQAAYRARDRGAKRNAAMELRESALHVFQRQGFAGESLRQLMALFDRYGVDVAQRSAQLAMQFHHEMVTLRSQR